MNTLREEFREMLKERRDLTENTLVASGIIKERKECEILLDDVMERKSKLSC